MGKKKNKNIWDIDESMQQKIADSLFAMEKDKSVSSILDISSSDVAGINENGFSSGLEDLIKSDMKFNPVKPWEEYPKEEIFAKENEIVELTSDISDIRSINFNLIPELNRIIIDDGVAPTSVSFDIAVAQELRPEFTDAFKYDDEEHSEYNIDTWEDFLIDILEYIISLKHPTAVYLKSEFTSNKYQFNRILNCANPYDGSKYTFLDTGMYILCYKTDPADFTVLYITLNSMSDVNNLKTWITMAYAVGTLNQAFYVEDAKYIEAYRNSKYNNAEEFHNEVINDSLTKLDDTPYDDGTTFEIESIEELQSRVRVAIATITNQYSDDDDDDDIDELFGDDEDDEELDEFGGSFIEDLKADSEADKAIVERMTTEEVDKLVSEDINDLLSSDMEEIKNVTPSKPVTQSTSSNTASNDDFDDFTVPVIRKK